MRKPLTLRRVGVGGWMNMENFITGYRSAEELQFVAPHGPAPALRPAPHHLPGRSR